MMVSLIQSNYMGFGSGIVVPGTGIALQNRGRLRDHQGPPQPGRARKRPFHTIIPAFLTKDGRPVVTFGVMGGYMQPQGHCRSSAHRRLRPEPAGRLDAPRWRVHERQDGVGRGAHAGRHDDGLEARGHKLTRTKWPSFDFGSSQIIWRFPEGGPYLAASESRRDGAAVGF